MALRLVLVALMLSGCGIIFDLPGTDAGTGGGDGTGGGSETGGGGGSENTGGGDTGGGNTGGGGTVMTPPRNLTVRWSVKNADGGTEPCPTGYDTIVLSATPLTDDDTFTGNFDVYQAPFERRFQCTQGSATISLPTSGNATETQLDCKLTTSRCSYTPVENINGRYLLEVHLAEASGETSTMHWPQYDDPKDDYTLEQKIDLTLGDASRDVVLYPDAVFQIFGWNLKAASNDNELSCASGNIDTVKVQAFYEKNADYEDVDAGEGFEVGSFPCTGQPSLHGDSDEDGVGLSAPLIPGGYRWVFTGWRAGAKFAERDMTFGDGSGPFLRKGDRATSVETKTLLVSDR